MDRKNPSVPPCAQVSVARRLVAAGSIRRTPDRTITVRVTEAGVTGTITPRRTVTHANGADHTVINPASHDARMSRGIHRVTMTDGNTWTVGLPIGWHGHPAAWLPTAQACCGRPMTDRDGQLVCTRCGAWIDPNVPVSDRAARVAELHRLARQDYTSSEDRRAQDHRDDAHLIAHASEAVAGL